MEAMKSGSLEAAELSSQGEALRKLSDDVNQAHQHFALVKSTYGPNHPEYRKAATRTRRSGETVRRCAEQHRPESRDSI